MLTNAINIFVEVLTAGGDNLSVDQRLSSSNTDRKVASHLAGLPKQYCALIAQRLNKNALTSDVVTACLRPVCLDASKTASDLPATCAPIGPNISEFRQAAVTAGEAVFGPCPTGSCIHADEATANLIVLTDQLRPLFREWMVNNRISECSEGNANPCMNAIGFLLTKVDRYWGLGQALTQAFSDLQSEASSRDIANAGDAAVAIDKIDPGHLLAKRWQQVAIESKRAAAGGTFPWDYRFITAVNDSQAVIDQVVTNAQSFIAAAAVGDELSDIYKRGAALQQLIAQSPGISKALPAVGSFVQQWNKVEKALGASPSNDDLVRNADLITGLHALVQNTEKLLHDNPSKLILGKDGVLARQCLPGRTAVNWAAGILDSCFADANATIFAGLRFVFAPCSAGEKPCVTSGDFRLLLRGTASDGTEGTIAVPLGVQNVKASVSENSVELNGVPPTFNFQSTPLTVIDGLKRIFPAAIQITDPGDVQLTPGPVVKINRATLDFAPLGLKNVPVSFSVNAQGVRIDNESFSLGLRKAIASQISNSIQVNNFSLVDVTALKSGDTCQGHLYDDATTLIALCAKIKAADVGIIHGVSEPLSVAVIASTSGAIRVEPLFDKGKVIAQLNKAIGSVLNGKDYLISVEGIELESDGLRVAVQGRGNPPCIDDLVVPFSGGNVAKLGDAGKSISDLIEFFGKCEARAIAAGLLKPFNLFMLKFANVSGDKGCLSDAPTICIVGVQVGADGSVDFSNARWQTTDSSQSAYEAK